ncbi:MAG: hypothetical protein ABUL69_02380 [Peristeroidobacter soli]
MRIALIVSTSLLAATAVAAEPTDQEIRAKVVELMQSTKMNMLMGLPVPAAEYKSDGDPDTLEVVMLEKKKDGPSRVSPDGEVIFLYKASDKKQQQLIEEAFLIRAKARLAK